MIRNEYKRCSGRKLSKTLRSGSDYKKTERDGHGRWRGCGDKYCPWCISNRLNNKRVR